MFGKKTTAEDVMKMFSALPDEEKKKFLEGVKPTTEEQIDEAKKDIAEKGPDSQTEKDRIDESVGEQEREDENEDSQTAKDRVDESEGMQKAEEKKDNEEAAAEPEKGEEPAEEKTADNADVTEALAARISALEEKLAAFEESLADKVEKDHNQDFGSSPSVPSKQDEGGRMADVMYGYAGANARKYY